MNEPDKYSIELERNILEIINHCFKCRFCIPSCPLFEINRGWITQGSSGITMALYYALKWGELNGGSKNELRNILYSCTTCKGCELTCKKMSVGVKLVEAIEKGRQLMIEKAIGPMPEQKKALESLRKYGNPYGMQPSKRTSWADDLGILKFSDKADIDVLFYVGCTPSYDDRVQNVARAVAHVLKKSQVRFGILENEACCGSPARRMGEEGLFQEISERNFNQFKSLGINQIITISPHCLNTFLNEYPEEIKGIRIQHYTQFFSDLINLKRLVPEHKIEKVITFQDPCYLGRHNDIYEEPRRILKNVPGIKFVELKRSKQESLCCGGGGGRMWADFDEERRLSEIRVKEALEIGADILVTACPFCLINMEDAIKEIGVKETLRVNDIAELLMEAI